MRADAERVYDHETGGTITVASGRARAQRRYPLTGVVCEAGGCDRAATDRHHVDGNTANNLRDNVALLCRSCHMSVDGRGQALAAHRRIMDPAPKPCVICGLEYKPRRRGRCARCSGHYSTWGAEWPDKGEGVDLTRKEPDVLTQRVIEAGVIVYPGGRPQIHRRTVNGWADGGKFYWIGKGRERKWVAF